MQQTHFGWKDTKDDVFRNRGDTRPESLSSELACRGIMSDRTVLASSFSEVSLGIDMMNVEVEVQGGRRARLPCITLSGQAPHPQPPARTRAQHEQSSTFIVQCGLGHSHFLQDESDVISTLTGFSLNNVLQGLSLPTGSGLTSSLGISGLPVLDASQIYNDKWDEEAVGADQGEDYEDEVDRELENESFGGDVKVEAQSPVSMRLKEKRVRIVRRLIERPRTVYERFPGFEKNKVLDFSDLFKGYTGKKSRIAKRPLAGE